MRRLLLSAVVPAALLAAPAAGDAAVTVGPDPLPARAVVASTGLAKIFTTATLPGATLAAPVDGVVTRWRVRRGTGPGILHADEISLRILRPTEIVNRFTAVGTSEIQAVPDDKEETKQVHEFTTRLPIVAGDRIGLGTEYGEFPGGKASGASYLRRLMDLDDGKTATFEPGASPDYFPLINAVIERDCDADGFGDETQDSSIPQSLACGFVVPANVAPPPDTLISKGPKKKVRTGKKRVTVSFKFGSDNAAASFECSLDKGKYRSCSSPQLYSVKATPKFKKHTFRVRAANSAGVDPTPATRTFKLKRTS